MDHELSPAAEAVRRHLAARFPSRELTVLPPVPGPIQQRVPGFHIFRLAPTSDEGWWLYVTAGMWDATQHDGHGIEFVLAAQSDEWQHLETVAMNAYYHAGGGSDALDHGHTVPIGRPWAADSACEYLLVSLPYPWGRRFEVCALPTGHARILWLLPITEAERDFKREHGLEALELRFQQAAINFSDPHRPSVV